MSKPGVFALTKLALDFFTENKSIFWKRMLAILPFAFVLIIVTQYGGLQKMAWVQMATLIPMILIQGLFALSWHRLSMRGEDSDYKVNPVWPKGSDWKFMRAFFSITLIPAIPPVLFMLLILSKVFHGEAFNAPVFVPYVYTASAILLLVVVQYVFLLPSSAGNLDLKPEQARRAAKGMRLRLLGGFLIYLLIIALAFSVYSGFVIIILNSIGAQTPISGWALLATISVFQIPPFIALMAFIALVSTMICRAYEWGMANNPLPA